ncbi:MAG: dihydropteroate synthase [Mariprofundus sp.]
MPSQWHRPADGDVRIMGVLNCTPDSFSDGGNYVDLDAAVAHGLAMQQAGAALIDIGGESTRPGAAAVSQQEELSRVIPLVAALSQAGCPVSLDTMKAEVMRQGIAAGATLINDVSALRFDAESAAVIADAGVDVCLMHMQGEPESMQLAPQYDDVLDDVCAFFQQRITACLQAGIAESAIILDPGIGFGKKLQDNLTLIRGIGLIKQRFAMPVLLGVSRKSFLGLVTGHAVQDRELETAVAGAMGIAYGADMLRVHDVAIQKRAVQIASAIAGQTPKYSGAVQYSI